MKNAFTIKAKYLSPLEAIRGLIGKDSGHPIFFHTRFGIHSFGMHVPIDILILDNEYIIRKISRNFKPYRFFFWNPLWNVVLELPDGFIAKNHLTLGMKIQLT